MESRSGHLLLHHVGLRVISRYLERSGSRVETAVRASADAAVDMTCWKGVARCDVKLKVDPYFGRDPVKSADWAMPFYRPEGGLYAFETVSHHRTRERGWVFSSRAHELYYYFLAIPQPEEEVRALLAEPDEVFFSELLVERDELHSIPLAGLRVWFEEAHTRYPPRPVRVGEHSAWYRLIPRADIDRCVPGIKHLGPAFTIASRDPESRRR